MEKYSFKKLLQHSCCHDAVGVGSCSLALLAYSLYHHYFDKNTSVWKMSPYLFPTLISIFGLLLALSLMADARQALRNAQDTAEPFKMSNLRGVFIVIGASLVYYFLMPLLTFTPATMLFLLALFIYLGECKWWKLLLLSGVTTGAIYVLFGIMLNVRLP